MILKVWSYLLSTYDYDDKQGCLIKLSEVELINLEKRKIKKYLKGVFILIRDEYRNDN